MSIGLCRGEYVLNNRLSTLACVIDQIVEQKLKPTALLTILFKFQFLVLWAASCLCLLWRNLLAWKTAQHQPVARALFILYTLLAVWLDVELAWLWGEWVQQVIFCLYFEIISIRAHLQHVIAINVAFDLDKVVSLLL